MWRHPGCDIDACEEPATHIRVVTDVLRHCYGVVRPDPRRVCDILYAAAAWYADARDSVDEDHLDRYWDDDSFRDRVAQEALSSGPSLPACPSLPCSDVDIPQEPYPCLGAYTFYESPGLLLLTARSVIESLS